ncbi:hypothetical protein [Pseudoalteromonas rubra]|uniref:Uncharacterized protein n=1 Tax=Pseudoalteromonas rubra TaxID=43658 RepID=A0A0F4QNU6_9GAMM|nr:hypothetical protein [Pseudoalteromonas rubra]KJZ08979.1 hypothetical protein TW77_11420 [Pseudoalteromonas rubra]
MEFIYKVFQYAPIFIVLFGLCYTWRFENARWFFITLGVVELIDELMIPVALNWETYYYVYCALMSFAFLLPIVYRKRLAHWFYEKTNYEYFYRCYAKHTVSAQEMLVICLVGLSCIINMLTFIEVLLYKSFLIDNAYLKFYVRDNANTLLHIVMILALLQFALRAEFREGLEPHEESN